MYQMSVHVVPVVIGHTGVMSTQCREFLQSIPEFSSSLLCHLQNAVSIHIFSFT